VTELFGQAPKSRNTKCRTGLWVWAVWLGVVGRCWSAGVRKIPLITTLTPANPQPHPPTSTLFSNLQVTFSEFFLSSFGHHTVLFILGSKQRLWKFSINFYYTSFYLDRHEIFIVLVPAVIQILIASYPIRINQTFKKESKSVNVFFVKVIHILFIDISWCIQKLQTYPALHTAIEIPRIALAPYFSINTWWFIF
jgi:hypothetical protein